MTGLNTSRGIGDGEMINAGTNLLAVVLMYLVSTALYFSCEDDSGNLATVEGFTIGFR